MKKKHVHIRIKPNDIEIDTPNEVLEFLVLNLKKKTVYDLAAFWNITIDGDVADDSSDDNNNRLNLKKTIKDFQKKAKLDTLTFKQVAEVELICILNDAVKRTWRVYHDPKFINNIPIDLVTETLYDKISSAYPSGRVFVHMIAYKNSFMFRISSPLNNNTNYSKRAYIRHYPESKQFIISGAFKSQLECISTAFNCQFKEIVCQESCFLSQVDEIVNQNRDHFKSQLINSFNSPLLANPLQVSNNKKKRNDGSDEDSDEEEDEQEDDTTSTDEKKAAAGLQVCREKKLKLNSQLYSDNYVEYDKRNTLNTSLVTKQQLQLKNNSSTQVIEQYTGRQIENISFKKIEFRTRSTLNATILNSNNNRQKSNSSSPPDSDQEDTDETITDKKIEMKVTFHGLDPIKGIEDLILKGIVKRPIPNYFLDSIYSQNIIKIEK
ncbi:hypothetical protein CYY_001767 [Polysphondylium violaceum]|uniref:Uncharacterized protein n=1 Tax=Polysphondylium violaceum TaxID=133409 RepID=A0A8J4Q2P4_9MYCE|nr:hypothetical protein CYY_001767 [Polysphondylium violaceum]